MEKKAHKFYVCCFENGDVIDEFNTYEEAVDAMIAYEESDMEEGIYTPGFYEIIRSV